MKKDYPISLAVNLGDCPLSKWINQLVIGDTGSPYTH